MGVIAQNYTEKVMRGTEALIGEIPHQVLLNYNNAHTCGGSILATYLILTAAHCLTNKTTANFQVVAGEEVRSNRSGKEQYRRISEAVIHPNYDTSEYGFLKGYDIALLVLDDELEFNDEVQSVLIPSSRHNFSDSALLSGWGFNMAVHPNKSSDVLRKARVLINSQSVCKKVWRSRYVEDKMICASDYGLEAEKGDSGGPLTCVDENHPSTNYVCGIVSYGKGDQKIYQNNYGVYTDVAYFHDWILNETARISSKRDCPRGHFTCSNRVCVPSQSVCDGQKDCLDGSDEVDCDGTKKMAAKNAVAMDAFYSWRYSRLNGVHAEVMRNVKNSQPDTEVPLAWDDVFAVLVG